MDSLFISNWNTQLKKGTLLLLVINIIRKKPSYGHEIIQRIKDLTGIEIADGTLYPLLKKLKKENLVVTRWEVSEEKAPRKFYYLTGKGNATLDKMNNRWRSLNKSIDSIIL